MTEWGVIGVIVVLVGLIAAIAKPLLSLNTSITSLSLSVKTLADNTASQKQENDKDHDEIWAHNDEQDKVLRKHEIRLHDLDGKTDGI